MMHLLEMIQRISLIGIKRCFILTTGLIAIVMLHLGCKKDNVQYNEADERIAITKNISIDNGINIHDPNLNLKTYEEFLKHLASNNRFLLVTQKDFDKTNPTDKVVISLRHDVDRNMDGAIRLAYREHKYGIKATYFILSTAKYYGSTGYRSFKRNDKLIYFLKKLQDAFGHEIGFHNDLVTLQIVYGMDPRKFLRHELNWLRNNGISIYGTAAHGSDYCYIYHYLNTYFWRSSPFVETKFYNYVSVSEFQLNSRSDNKHQNLDDLNIPGDNANNNVELSEEQQASEQVNIQIIKDDKENYDLTYDSDYLILNPNYNFSDNRMYPGGKRWHMGKEDFDKIPLGEKVIILIHPEHWD
jgi:hypothetical protein